MGKKLKRERGGENRENKKKIRDHNENERGVEGDWWWGQFGKIVLTNYFIPDIVGVYFLRKPASHARKSI